MSDVPSPSRPPAKKPSVDLFDFGETLGVGAFGKVVVATHKETGKQYAAKVLSKQRIVKEGKLKYITTERDALSSFDHAGVIKLAFTFQDPARLYILLEIAENGMLLEYTTAGPLDVAVARFYLAETLLAIAHVHDRGYLHRDIKPDNVLVGADGHVKVTDFGTAKKVAAASAKADAKPTEDGGAKERRNSFVGSDEYVAPEVLSEEADHTTACDVWSFGVMAFMLLVGRVPFKGATQFLTFRAVQDNNPEYPDDIDADAKDLISNILKSNPDDRLTVDQIKAHKFFEGVDWDTIFESEPPALPPRVKIDGQS